MGPGFESLRTKIGDQTVSYFCTRQGFAFLFKNIEFAGGGALQGAELDVFSGDDSYSS